MIITLYQCNIRVIWRAQEVEIGGDRVMYSVYLLISALVAMHQEVLIFKSGNFCDRDGLFTTQRIVSGYPVIKGKPALKSPHKNELTSHLKLTNW